MEEKKQNEELQSRREFFKEAARKALPVISAIALASSPIIARAAEKTPMDCNYGCSGGCSSSCRTECYGTCKETCLGHCKGSCWAACRDNCKSGSLYN